MKKVGYIIASFLTVLLTAVGAAVLFPTDRQLPIIVPTPENLSGRFPAHSRLPVRFDSRPEIPHGLICDRRPFSDSAGHGLFPATALPPQPETIFQPGAGAFDHFPAIVRRPDFVEDAGGGRAPPLFKLNRAA